MTERIQAITCLIALQCAVGCSHLPVTFDVRTQSRTTIEKGTAVEQLVGSLGFGQFTNLDLAQSQEFRSNNVQKRHVASAKLKALTLSITAPQGQNFDFLESLTFFIESPGMPRRRLAHQAIPRGATRLTFEPEDVELAPYVRADTMTITTEVRGRRPDRDTEVQCSLVLTVSTVLWRGN
jgi:hypothetical protein